MFSRLFKCILISSLLSGCDSGKTDQRIATTVDSVITVNKYLDSVLGAWREVDGVFDSMSHDGVRAYLLSGRSMASKLLMITRQEEDSTMSDSCIYFFGPAGEVIGYELKGDEKYDLHYFLFFHKTSVLLVRDKETYIVDTLDQLSSCSKKAIAHREVSSVMQFFLSVHYKNVELPGCYVATLSTRSEVLLLSEPRSDSRLIKRLSPGTSLVYTGSQIGDIQGTTARRIWYKVKTEDNTEGWIFGDPKFVSDFEG